MSREFLKAYLITQQSHKNLHRLLKAFEEDLPDSVLLDRISQVEAQLQEVRERINRA